MKFKVDSKMVLGAASLLLGVATMIVNDKKDSNSKAKLKEDIKKEVLESLSKNEG